MPSDTITTTTTTTTDALDTQLAQLVDQAGKLAADHWTLNPDPTTDDAKVYAQAVLIQNLGQALMVALHQLEQLTAAQSAS